MGVELDTIIKRLVLDTSIAHSASETDHPISMQCRQIIAVILENPNYRLVMTPKMQAEWQPDLNDPNNRRKIWRLRRFAELQARDKFIFYNDNEIEDSVLRALVIQDDHKNQRTNPNTQLIKDVHLVEAALFTDRIVISKDSHARRDFKKLILYFERLKWIVWVDGIQDTDCLQWLDQGALSDERRMLGYQSE